MIRIFVLGISTLLMAAQSAPPANVEKGKESFKVHGCVACHGFSG